MALFFLGLTILFLGYKFYGRLVERLVGVDDRPTPGRRLADGVDYVVMPQWRNMLIQLLNIAGIGPIIGVIIGIKFGVIVFLIIPIGNIIGGAVHDFLAGMMSLRNDGQNLPGITRKYLGPQASFCFSLFLTLVLLLVVVVFVNIPANLVKNLLTANCGATDSPFLFWLPAVAIFVYYIAAALMPVDKIIGRVYPVFGGILLFGSLALLGSSLWRVFAANRGKNSIMPEWVNDYLFEDGGGVDAFNLILAAVAAGIVGLLLFRLEKRLSCAYNFFSGFVAAGTAALLFPAFNRVLSAPELLTETPAFSAAMFTAAGGRPIIPLLFVTIACGILSGFHATQSPIVARAMASEREARQTFYGMMVTEGVIAMIWAAAALIIYNQYPALLQMAAPAVLFRITDEFLGTLAGGITVVSVIILAITSGDTAMRSLRLSFAETVRIPQKKPWQRVAVSLPLIAAAVVFLWWSNAESSSFEKIWNYFAWGNQIIAAVTLLSAVVWLMQNHKSPWIAIVPGMFITFVVTVFILWTSPAHHGPYGFGLPLATSYAIAAMFTAAATAWVCLRGAELREQKPE